MTITSYTPGASIYYRFDYQKPTTSDLLYTEPITMSSTTTVTAITVSDGVESAQRNGVFAIREPGYTNIIANGDFSEGTNGWYLWTEGTANAMWTTSDADSDGDDELVITITNGGNESYHVQANFDIRFPTEEGELYELRFTAWADPTGPHDFGILTIRIDESWDDADGDGNNFEAYFFRPDIITDQPREFRIPVAIYVSENHSNPLTRFALDLGTEEGIEQTGTFYIDDVSLELVENPAPYSDIVTSAAVRTALMESIWETGDSDQWDLRFDGISESEVTAFHIAAIHGIWIDDGTFEDAGYTAADFDLSAIDLDYFGSLDGFGVDDLPFDNNDAATLSSYPQLRWLNLGNTNGDDDLFTGTSDIFPLTSLRRLKGLGVVENEVAVSNLTTSVTPSIFPDLEELRLDLAEVGQVTSAEADDIVGIFTDFGTAGNTFYEVELDNAGLTDSQFLTLYSGLLSDSTSTLETIKSLR